MRKGRRWFGLVLIAVLAIPALSMPFTPLRTWSPTENRNLAPTPAMPRTFAEWRVAPRALDAFLADHFGFRKSLLKDGERMQRRMGVIRPLVAEGRDGRLFLNEGLLRSTGQEVRAEEAADYAAFVCDAARRLAAKGMAAAFAIAPSPAAIYPETAPPWALPAKTPTQYDLTLDAVRGCGVATADLRPALWAAKPSGLLYWRTDSHWTQRGAMAAFNPLTMAMGRPAWRLDAATADWRRRQESGDLPRMAGLPPRPEWVEVARQINLPPGTKVMPIAGFDRPAGDSPHMIDTGRSGETVMIIGDSYAEHYTALYMAQFAGRVAWVHHQKCKFDWRIIDAVKPDRVLIMPVDRFAFCEDGARPW
jgi:uncharacterized protein (DUF2249 family)